MKLRIGILFGGNSREREISFAGGRTVYDNLNKSLFEPVPVFVDSFGNFVLLDWQFIYKGSIRDFYPPVELLPSSPNGFQVYAESLGNPDEKPQDELISKIGKKIPVHELRNRIDFAFLCLHGTNGEDGRIQGMLEFLEIPYSGSGILSSSIGMNKAVQKKLMTDSGFSSPPFFTLLRHEWKNETSAENIFNKIKEEIGFPCVVKAANQGSSIGVTIISSEDVSRLSHAIDRSFFIRKLEKKEWHVQSEEQKINYLRSLADIRDGIGIPLVVSSRNSKQLVFHPEDLLELLNRLFLSEVEVVLESCEAESEIVIEGFISGKEFSCIVIRDEEGKPVALPPTEIRKGKELFDYRSKYLPGLSRKITPINLPDDSIRNIRKECERLFLSLKFNVYARIDGFITEDGKIFLNDPNTTSGMMPSSFFFHQAAEIGLNPSQFLTYIIRTSLVERMADLKNIVTLPAMLSSLDQQIISLRKESRKKIKVAVIFGGYSSERHISVESGRNIYEKLSSSEKYEPVPVFLTGTESEHEMYQVPVNLLLKDNADDIREKVLHYTVHEVVREIMDCCEQVTTKYSSPQNVLQPHRLTYEQLAGQADEVFIALHGRPGEDGEVQRRLEQVGLPYNGSGVSCSRLTINKFETNEVLKKHGFLVARHELVNAEEWKEDQESVLKNITSRFSFPFIAKPVDDGCSSAVKKITNAKEFRAFAELMFRKDETLTEEEALILNLKLKEEFPRKKQFLVEELISRNGAEHFLEITGGMLTKLNDKGQREYQVFEASEALSEGDVLSLEEKFLAGEGQNITPARYSRDHQQRERISDQVKEEFLRAAKTLNIEGYARIDAFARILATGKTEVIFIEVNSLPGMTPATCIFHQAAMAGYKPYEFIDEILEYGRQKKSMPEKIY
ncbi:MAG: D-alanine--D-alanine ligase [Bacteroidetes bacterium]|nr:D-alanine--D-alanine ligase [Bacteroidota bacterium]